MKVYKVGFKPSKSHKKNRGYLIEAQDMETATELGKAKLTAYHGKKGVYLGTVEVSA